ncbi:MAG: alpha/beta fold hydrolase [Actinomycetota bacterium]
MAEAERRRVRSSSTARRLRRLAVGAGVAAVAAVGAVVAERTAARRLRARPDAEGREDLGALPPEDLGPVTSFDGTKLHLRAAGPPDAPALVFLHGITLDMTTWHYQWTALSDRYRCILFDARAHGRSGRPASGDYSLGAMAKDLKAVLDTMVPNRPAVLIGHSMGGMAILSFAEQFPEEFGNRVVGVVLVDTAASDVLRDVFGGIGARVGQGLRRVGKRYTTRPDLAERLQRRIRGFGADFAFLVGWATNFGPNASPSQVEHITRLASEAPVEVWTQTLQSLLEMDLKHAIERVTVPSLVIVGDRDLLTPKTSAQALRSALPDARAVVITGAGHISMMERHQVFNEVLEGYLEQMLAVGTGRRGRRARKTSAPA